MVALGAGAVAIVITGGAAAPAALAGAQAGVAFGTGLATAGSTAVSAAAAGAISGGVAGVGTAATAVSGAAGAVAGGLTSSGMCLAISGPVGWAVLGASGVNDELSYDCWKQIVRDTSPEPSRGRLLRDVASSSMIREVLMLPDSQTQIPQLHLKNVWNECFRLDFGFLPSGELAAHAVRVDLQDINLA